MRALIFILVFIAFVAEIGFGQSKLSDEEISKICNDAQKCEEFFLNWEQESFEIVMRKDWDGFIKETKRISRLAAENGQLELSRNVMSGVYETQFMLRDHDGALKTVDSLLSLDGLTDLNRYSFLYRAGTLYNHKEQYEKGIPMLLESIELTPKDDNLFLPTVYSDLANALQKMGRSQEAIDYLILGLEMDKRNVSRATKYLNISHIYNSIGNIAKGEEYLAKSDSLYDKNSVNYYQSLLTQKALIHLRKNELDMAEELVNTITTFVDTAQIKKPDHYYLLIKADLESKKGELANMKVSLSKIDTTNFYQAFKKLYYTELWTRYYIQIEDMDAAKTQMKRYSKQIATSKNASAIQSYQLSKIMMEKKMGNYQKALEYTDEYQRRADSIYRSGQEKYVLDLSERYESEKKQLKIDQLNAENQVAQLEIGRRNRMLVFGGILLALASLFGFLVYRLFQRTKASESSLKKANADLSESLQTNKALLKEIHHRVKNNLQVVSSLLTLQSKFVEDDSALAAINTGKSRVQSMSILHRNLYQNENLKSIKIKPYFDDLIENLVATYQVGDKNISISSEADDIELDIDMVIPMGLITNELISNCLKYAFHGKNAGQIALKIKKSEGELTLSVKDDGIGMPFTEIPKRSKTLGMQLIHSFSKKLKGDIQIRNTEGTEIMLTMPYNQLEVVGAKSA